MAIRTVVFDFAGVLFRWHPPALIRRELPDRAPDEAAGVRWARDFFQGYDGDWAAFDRGTVAAPDLVARIAARTGLTPAEVQRVVDGVPGELQPVPETVALVERLHAAGVPLAYLSNMPAPYADRLEAENAFVGLFRAGVFSARVGLVKPERAIFDRAAEVFATPPSELLFFDDHAPNVDAARAAGWKAALFTDAAAAADALRAHGLLPD